MTTKQIKQYVKQNHVPETMAANPLVANYGKVGNALLEAATGKRK